MDSVEQSASGTSCPSRHRGAHPSDATLFGPHTLEILNAALGDYVMLLNRNYPETATLKLVGDHFSLRRRQRLAVQRCAAQRAQVMARRAKEVTAAELTGAAVELDGYNLLVTLETALGGGVVLKGCDGCWRDVSGVHGSYRMVQETRPAIEAVGAFLAASRCANVLWWLDRPVSNSGRLAQYVRQVGSKRGWDWEVQLANNPDRRLIEAKDSVVVSSDAMILDHAGRWFNLLDSVINALPLPPERVIDLSAVSSA